MSHVDRKGAELTTYWEDTGYRYRETEDLEDETNVFVRYHVAISGVAGEHRVSVRADVQRCVPYRAAITAREVVSSCLGMKGLLPRHQKALDNLGRELSSALSPGPRATSMSTATGRRS